MTGSKPLGAKRRSVVVQPRDRRLLEELATMRVIDREQAKQAAGFTSTSRVNARLLALTGAGLLRRFFIGTIGMLVHATMANTFIIVRIMEPYWILAAIVVVAPQVEKEEAESDAGDDGDEPDRRDRRVLPDTALRM